MHKFKKQSIQLMNLEALFHNWPRQPVEILEIHDPITLRINLRLMFTYLDCSKSEERVPEASDTKETWTLIYRSLQICRWAYLSA